MITHLLRQRFSILNCAQFRALFLRMLCNRLVDGMVYVVTAWMLLRITDQASSVALQLSLTLLSSALLSPVIGTVTDRFSRRNLVVIADLFQGGLIALTALMLALSSVQVPIYLYAMTLAVGLSSTLHSVAARALLRELVDKEGLLSASSTISIANQTGGLLGPILGGLLAYRLGEVSVLVIAAGLSVAGGLNLLQVSSRASHSSTHSATTMVLEYMDTFHLLRTNKVVRRLFISCTMFYVSLPLLNFLLPLLTMKTFGLSVQSFGVIDAMFGVGGIAAGIFLHALEERFGQHHMIVFGVVIFGLSITLFPMSAQQPWLITMYLLIGFACHSGVGLMSELQCEVPSAMQGRVLSMFSTGTALVATATVQLLGLAGGAKLVVVAYVIYGLGLVVFGLVFLRRWMQPPA